MSLESRYGPAPYQLAIERQVVATAWLASTSAERRRGLLGTTELSGALWITRCPSVHTFGMHYPIDVAFVDKRGIVIDVVTMAPDRPGRPRWRARATIEAPATMMGKWGVIRGSRLTLEGVRGN